MLLPRIIDFLEMTSTNSIAWNDINFEGLNLRNGASAPDLVSILASGGVYGLGFDGNATPEQAFGGGEIIHDYKEGTDLLFHVHWMPSTTETGNVEWNIEYTWQNVEDSDNVLAAPSTISTVQATTGVAWLSKVKGFDAVDGTGKKIGSHIIFRLHRDPTSSNDTYASDAILMSVGIHYQVNTLGSEDVFTK